MSYTPVPSIFSGAEPELRRPDPQKGIHLPEALRPPAAGVRRSMGPLPVAWPLTDHGALTALANFACAWHATPQDGSVPSYGPEVSRCPDPCGRNKEGDGHRGISRFPIATTQPSPHQLLRLHLEQALYQGTTNSARGVGNPQVGEREDVRVPSSSSACCPAPVAASRFLATQRKKGRASRLSIPLTVSSCSQRGAFAVRSQLMPVRGCVNQCLFSSPSAIFPWNQTLGGLVV